VHCGVYRYCTIQYCIVAPYTDTVCSMPVLYYIVLRYLIRILCVVCRYCNIKYYSIWWHLIRILCGVYRYCTILY